MWRLLDGVEHYLSRENRRLPFRTGRIDTAAVQRFMTTGPGPDAVDAWFLCGPRQLLDDTAATLSVQGVDDERIHMEVFDTTPGRPSIVADAHLKSAVRVLANGQSTEIESARGEYILDAALRARDDLAYSCMSRSCGSCRVMVRSGEVDLDDEARHSLSEDELRAGYALACLTRPVSEQVTVDFDG